MCDLFHGKLVSNCRTGEGSPFDIHVNRICVGAGLGGNALKERQGPVVRENIVRRIALPGQRLSLRHGMGHCCAKVEVAGFVVRRIGIRNIRRQQLKSLAVKGKCAFPEFFTACACGFYRAHKYSAITDRKVK